MKYLFFDIECANCQGSQGKIFSFGYLVTDRDFNLLTPPTDILMNPDSHFEPYVLNKILSYPMEQIRSSPEFPEHYEKLKQLLEDPDTMVIGFAVRNDVGFLLDECFRYQLQPFSFRFYDIQQIIERQEINQEGRSLEKAYEAWCGEIPEIVHRSDADAELTMQVLAALCRYHSLYPDEMLTEKGIDTKMQFSAYVDCMFAPIRERLKNPDRFILKATPISRKYTQSLGADTAFPEPVPYIRNAWPAPKCTEEYFAQFKQWQKVFPGTCVAY